MSNLKSRIAKLEAAGTEATYPGIVIYFENAVHKENEDGISEMVDADYYLNEDRTEAVTVEEINELGKDMIVFLPLREKILTA